MKKRIVALITALAVLLFAASASASPVIQIWSCDLIDGHSGSDLIEASSDWLNVAKVIDGGAEFNVLLRFPLAADAGDDDFRFVLIAPDAKTWGTWVDKSFGDAALAKVNAAWSEVAYCSGSSMWSGVNIE